MDGRRDLRSWCIFSIDPASARDLDDAVSCEALPGNRWACLRNTGWSFYVLLKLEFYSSDVAQFNIVYINNIYINNIVYINNIYIIDIVYVNNVYIDIY